MIDTKFDTCIIGQGLAGTTLAWALHLQGQRIVVIDQGREHCASQIAAGLITPITGKRFVKSWRFDEFWKSAKAFYREIESVTNRSFFHQQNSVRLFSNKDKRDLLIQKSVNDFPGVVHLVEQPVNATSFNCREGGFEMNHAARLNIPCYLNVSQKFFSQQAASYKTGIELETDLKIEADLIRIPKLEIVAKRVICCQGFVGSKNHWFETVPFDAVKGEILTLHIPGLNECKVVHRGIWLVPLGDDLYKAGATYDRDHLDMIPTKAGKEELCTRLAELITLPFEVVAQHAAIRPVIVGRQPIIGFHPSIPPLGYFNGLGSKGSLQAPWFAQLLTRAMTDNITIPPEFDVQQFLQH